jgi:hypothetical protein
MLYRELLEQLQNLEDEQLEMPVMIDVDEEFYPASQLEVHENSGRLTDGHPYVTII